MVPNYPLVKDRYTVKKILEKIMIKNFSNILAGLLMTIFTTTSWADKLADINQELIEKYPTVKHISAEELKNQLNVQNRSDVILFDVRESKEYAVSHLDGAIRIDPSIKTDDFFKQYDDDLKGKTAIFYCSVGRRSSQLINRLETTNNSDKSLEMLNLEGGIFRWTNDTLPVDGVGVHPYNWYWSRLIDDKSMIHYSPL